MNSRFEISINLDGNVEIRQITEMTVREFAQYSREISWHELGINNDRSIDVLPAGEGS